MRGYAMPTRGNQKFNGDGVDQEVPQHACSVKVNVHTQKLCVSPCHMLSYFPNLKIAEITAFATVAESFSKV